MSAFLKFLSLAEHIICRQFKQIVAAQHKLLDTQGNMNYNNPIVTKKTPIVILNDQRLT